jgi:alpha-1,3-fucosyltransferase
LDEKLAVWVVSHCHTEGKRERIAAELAKYIPIDVYGTCGDLDCTLPRNASIHPELCHPDILENKYKFYLAFENSLCTDYVTEKFFNILDTGMIPIVYGGADYRAMFPPYSFIDVQDFPSIQKLAEYITSVSRNPSHLAKYFEWRKGYSVVFNKWLPGYCEICEKLISNKERMTISRIRNTYNWWMYGNDGENAQYVGTRQCRSKSFANSLFEKLVRNES